MAIVIVPTRIEHGGPLILSHWQFNDSLKLPFCVQFFLSGLIDFGKCWILLLENWSLNIPSVGLFATPVIVVQVCIKCIWWFKLGLVWKNKLTLIMIHVSGLIVIFYAQLSKYAQTIWWFKITLIHASSVIVVQGCTSYLIKPIWWLKLGPPLDS